jgi:hypothetical protein
MMPNDTDAGSESTSRPDEKRMIVRELEAGPGDPLPDFQDDINAKMEELGNRVGRTCVMKVTVEVFDTELADPSEVNDGE